ncbi:MAG: enoyl-CoA hydratase-related protein [Thermoplasmata archaeon]|nr:enoyl-CoA hydratase-related protein [Thermoplasmata archaeon]
MSTEVARPLVRSERTGAVLVLTLDHPPVNVLSRAVLEALLKRLEEAEADPRVRVVVLASAAEKAFAAGADIREMARMGPDEARVHGSRGQAVTRRIERLPLPVIAAVHGVCLGGGCEVALACDFVLASPDALFGQPEINLGVTPGWGGSQRLPRRIGVAKARRWIYTGRPVSAAEAHADGWVERIVPREDLLRTAVEFGVELAGKPALALAASKYEILRAADPSLDAALDYELDLWSRLFGTRDQREGMQAFLEKKPLAARDRSGWSESSLGFPWGEPPDAPGASTPSGKRKRDDGSGRD